MKTSMEVCNQLKMKYFTLDYLIRNNYVPTPKKLASWQRIFSDEDIKIIKAVVFDRIMSK